MLFPYIWRSLPSNVPAYKEYGKNLISLLAANPNDSSEFNTYFTLPSFFELLDSFHHHAKNAEFLLAQTNSYDNYQKSYSKGFVLNQTSISSEQAEKELKKIKSITKLHDVKHSLDQAIKLIGCDGRISGIDDVIHEGVHYNKRDVNNFQKIFESMKVDRSFNDSRDDKNRFFHYKVDAANIVTTRIVGNLEGVDSMFVTHESMIQNYCSDMGLNAQMPYIWLSAHLLCKQESDSFGDDIDALLKSAQKFLKESLGYLRKYNGKPIPAVFQEIIDLSHSNFLEPIHRRNKIMYSASSGSNIDEYDNSYDSYVKFKSTLEETRDVIGDSAKFLSSKVPFLLDSETMSIFKLSDDEMVSEIINDFGLYDA